MGVCSECGRNTGLWWGKRVVDGHEFCGDCGYKHECLASENRYKMKKILMDSISIPENAITITCKKGLKKMERDMQNNNIHFRQGYSVILWEEQNDLCYTYELMPMKFTEFEKLNDIYEVMPVFKINNEDFIFYAREGDFYIKTDVSGGGANLGGAITGGLLFGAAGAIIGSRERNKTTTTEVDKRITTLYYKYKDELIEAQFDKDAYNKLKNIFPTKDAEVMDKLLKYTHQKDYNKYDTNEDIYLKIEKLGELMEKGYITEKEFGDKKQQLLDKL